METMGRTRAAAPLAIIEMTTAAKPRLPTFLVRDRAYAAAG